MFNRRNGNNNNRRILNRRNRLRRACAAADDLLARLEQVVAALRARRVRVQPLVDAADVEAVVALGQEADTVSGGELGEADSALDVDTGEVHVGGVIHRRERIQRLLLDPGVRRRAGSGGGRRG